VVDKILNHPQYLNTPEKAVAWLESHKDQLILGELGDWGDKKGDLVILGIEPAGNPASTLYDSSGKLQRRLTKVKEEDTGDLKDRNWEKWYGSHPLTFVNDLRQLLQVSNTLKKRGGADVPLGQAAGALIGRSKGGAEGYQRGNVEGRDKKRPFIRKLLKMSNGTPWESLRGSNISPVGIPSDKFWPFSDLPFKPDSPFKSRDTWVRYASTKMAEKIKVDLKENPRKLVIFGANRKEHQEMFKMMAKDLGGSVSSETLQWSSSNGRPMRAIVSTFVVSGPFGRTVFVQTSHPSWTGWTDEALDKVDKIVVKTAGLQN